MIKARLAYHDKAVYPDGAILEMSIWELPKSVAGSRHFLKYSLFYGYPGRRLVGYDNERGKGDHRHFGNLEEGYHFTTVEQLITDFLSDVEKQRSTQ